MDFFSPPSPHKIKYFNKNLIALVAINEVQRLNLILLPLPLLLSACLLRVVNLHSRVGCPES